MPDDVLVFSFVASRGPGGQNVNKRATKAELRLRPERLGVSAGVLSRLLALAGRRVSGEGELIITADESRSQEANRRACLDRLRDLLVRARTPPRPRRPTKPTRGSKERRIAAKQRRSGIKSARRRPHDE